MASHHRDHSASHDLDYPATCFSAARIVPTCSSGSTVPESQLHDLTFCVVLFLFLFFKLQHRRRIVTRLRSRSQSESKNTYRPDKHKPRKHSGLRKRIRSGSRSTMKAPSGGSDRNRSPGGSSIRIWRRGTIFAVGHRACALRIVDGKSAPQLFPKIKYPDLFIGGVPIASACTFAISIRSSVLLIGVSIRHPHLKLAVQRILLFLGRFHAQRTLHLRRGPQSNRCPGHDADAEQGTGLGGERSIRAVRTTGVSLYSHGLKALTFERGNTSTETCWRCSRGTEVAND